MTDTEKLNDIIKSSGIKKKWIAEQLGLTGYSLQKKIDNRSFFYAKEIASLCKILNINSLKEKNNIFFAEEVPKK